MNPKKIDKSCDGLYTRETQKTHASENNTAFVKKPVAIKNVAFTLHYYIVCASFLFNMQSHMI